MLQKLLFFQKFVKIQNYDRYQMCRLNGADGRTRIGRRRTYPRRTLADAPALDEVAPVTSGAGDGAPLVAAACRRRRP